MEQGNKLTETILKEKGTPLEITQGAPTTVHASQEGVFDLIERLSQIDPSKFNHKQEVDMSPHAILDRLRKNMQYNSSPAVSYLKVGKEDAKIIIDIMEKVFEFK